MSNVIRSRYPHCSATQTAPVTPPAGPESSIVTGESIAFSAADSPPSLRRIANSPGTPAFDSSPARLVTYRFTCGWT